MHGLEGKINDMPILSVIVPIYNSEKYLSRCIESIRKQSLRNIEIILVDDGSTDHSAEICLSFCERDKRIVFHQTRHGGPIQARYKGLITAVSEYVTFVDSDDWIEPDAYERMLQYIDEDVDVIKYRMIFEDVNGKRIPYKNKYSTGVYTKSDIEREIYPTMIWDHENNTNGVSSSLCDKIIKKDLLIKSFNLADKLNYHYCEDSTIIFPLYQWVSSLIISDEILYHHCKNEGVSEYLIGESFFDDLYKWYKHLLNNAAYFKNAVQQIEEIYVAAMKPRIDLYGDRPDRVRFLFPFGKIASGAKVIIWGYGVVGKSYVNQIEKTDYCEVVDIVDSGLVESKKYDIKKPDIVKSQNFDYVVIAVGKPDVKESIYNDLIGWNIPKEKIVRA